MPGVRIPNLPTATSPLSSDVFPIVSNNTTGQVSFFNAATSVALTNTASPNYVFVSVSDNAVANGSNLLNAYATACTFTPNASALSSTNRAVVFLPSANYNLGSSSLNLRSQYVDIVGLTRDASHVNITSSSSTATISQTANDIRVIGLTVSNIVSAAGWSPSSNLSLTYWENVTFSSISANNLSGTFKNCKSTNSIESQGGFVKASGTASGTFIDCTGANTGGFDGGGFVGQYGTASGTFTNCTGTNLTNSGGGFVGGSGLASGTFYTCTGVNSGASGGGFVGNMGIASGNFYNCTGTNSGDFGGGFVGYSSVGNADASGNFYNCTGTNTGTKGGGFVGMFGRLTGRFFNCTGTNTGTDGGGLTGYSCRPSGTFINCIGVNTGTGGRGLFGPYATVQATVINCTTTDATLPALINSGVAAKPACYINCLDGSGNLVNGSA
jgi:hypothetical protein